MFLNYESRKIFIARNNELMLDRLRLARPKMAWNKLKRELDTHFERTFM